MQLNIDLKDFADRERKKTERVKEVVKNVKATLEVTEEDWDRVFKMKNSKPDVVRLKAVRDAWREGKILPTAKFSKTEALRMYKRYAETLREDKLRELVENTPSNYVLVDTEEKLGSLQKFLENETLIAVDTETTGLDTFRKDEMVGISLSLDKADLHYYIPVRHKDVKQLPVETVVSRLKPYLEDPKVKKVLFNAKFDSHVLIREGVRMKGLEMDCMVAIWLLSENEPSYRLKDLATKYLKEPSDTYEELFGKDARFDEIPIDVALVYASKDTHLTLRFYKWILSHMTKDKLKNVHELYKRIENGIVDVCVNMEQTGFYVDFEYAKAYGEELAKELKDVEVKLYKHFPKDLNFNSPLQLQKVFYDEWNLPDVSGKRSTDADTLKRLADETDNEGISTLLRYRDLTKLIGTYVEKLPNDVGDDGRLHGQFKQSGTVTGRFASSNPNLQNIPGEARRLFVAPEGQVIIGADYSQIEPRVLAHMAQDKHLQEPYLKGIDLYSTLASRVFKKPMEECLDGSKYRKMMKVGLLAVMYGTSMFTLAKQIGITVQEAEKFIADFFETYPAVEAWIQGIHEQVKANEYVETMHGRKRRFPGHRQEAIAYDNLAKKILSLTGEDKLPSSIWDAKYKKILPYDVKRQFQSVKGSVERVRRMAVNAIIQGSAADIMKMALIEVDKFATENNWNILATVHDEVLMYAPETVIKSQVDELERRMTSVVTLDIPLKVDAMLTRRWGADEKSKDEWFGG